MAERPPVLPNLGAWLAALLLGFIALLPWRFGHALVVPLAALARSLMKSRRKVALKNVQRCFPEMSAAQHQALVKDAFRGAARSMLEYGWAYVRGEKFLASIATVEGLEHLQQANSDGQGVLLLTGHITCFGMANRALMMTHPRMKFLYRPFGNPVFEWIYSNGMNRFCDGLISKRKLGVAIRYLRKGGVLWYAPDQDFGPKNSEFVPFFGIPTATLTATLRIQALSGCRVVPTFPRFDEKTRRYTVQIFPPLENFPSGDDLADLARINELIEHHIRQAPGQYWWIHRRFKTRPEGEPPFYQ